MTHATSSSSLPVAPRVQRDLGLFDAVIIGLSAIIGAGVYAGIGIGAGIAGPAVLFAIVLAALVALCNGLTGAQLMSHHTKKRSQNEYSHRRLQPYLDFFSGWMILFAKAAAAATVALCLSGYALTAFGQNEKLWRMGIGLLVLVLLTRAILGNFRLTTWATAGAVILAIGTLIYFCGSAFSGLVKQGEQNFQPFFIPPSFGTSPLRSIFHASALMFLAYAGVEHIAALHKGLRTPQRTIPRAIVIALLFAMVLYLAVATVAIGNAGAEMYSEATLGAAAPLAIIAGEFIGPAAAVLVAGGAVVALLLVEYNLILSLSHTMLTMGRRKHMPNIIAKVDKAGKTPERAVLAGAGVIAVMILIGDVHITWSFGAFTALLYYALSNLAALQVPKEERILPRFIPMAGLLCCLFLAFWVEPVVWITGLSLIFLGVGWRWLMHRI